MLNKRDMGYQAMQEMLKSEIASLNRKRDETKLKLKDYAREEERSKDLAKKILDEAGVKHANS